MDEAQLNKAQTKEIIKRLERTPDDYYISDTGNMLYALLGGVFLWSVEAPEGHNFLLWPDAEIVSFIHETLSKKLK